MICPSVMQQQTLTLESYNFLNFFLGFYLQNTIQLIK